MIGIQTDKKEIGAPGPYSVGSDCKSNGSILILFSVLSYGTITVISHLLILEVFICVATI